MLQDESGMFINVAKLDLRKYAKRPALAKALFLYMYHVTNDTLKALEFAAISSEECEFKDWWWKGALGADWLAGYVLALRRVCAHLNLLAAALGMCYYRLGMFRDAFQVDAGLVVEAMQPAQGDQPRQIAVAALAGGQQHQLQHVRRFLAHPQGGDIDLAADDRLDARLERSLMKLEGSKQVPTVGQGYRRHPLLTRRRHQIAHAIG